MNFTADFSQPYILNLAFPDVTAYRSDSNKDLHLTLNNMLGSLQIPFGFFNIYVEPSTFGANLKKQSYPMNNGYIAVLGSPLFNSPLNDFQYANISVSNCPNFSQNIIQTEGNIQINNCANFDAELAAVNGTVYIGNCPNFNKPLSFCNKQYDFKYHSGSGVITNCPNFNSSVNIHANNAQCGTMYNLIKSNLPKGDVFVNGGNLSYMFQQDYGFNANVSFGSGAFNDFSYMFYGANNFDKPITIPNSVTNCVGMFSGASKFDRAIDIPDSVTNCSYMFQGASGMNHGVTIGSGVNNCYGMFGGCTALDKVINIPDNVHDVRSMFVGCVSLNQPFIIGNSIVDFRDMFANCSSFNSPVIFERIISELFSFQNMFFNCALFNQAITIPDNSYATLMLANCQNFNNSVTIGENCICDAMFRNCKKMNVPVYIPASTKHVTYMFADCNSMDSTISFPRSLLESTYNNRVQELHWSSNALNCLSFY